MSKSSSYTREEEKEYEREESQRESVPGLFSLSPHWFKFSNYEILDTKHGLYITPTKSAVKELYEPFTFFPNILEDYLNLLFCLKNMDDTQEKALNKAASNNYSNDKYKRLYIDFDNKKAEKILPFVKKYGLFGLFDDCISRINPDIETMHDQRCNEQEIKSIKYIAVLKPRSQSYMSDFFQKNDTGNSYTVEYEKLASYYLPRLSSPYPNVMVSKEQAKTFYENYAEPLSGILSYPDAGSILLYENLLKEFENTGSKLDDVVKSIHLETGRTDITYRRSLYFDVANLGFSISPDNGNFDLKWNFKSLFSALSIMYAMNKTGTLGGKFQICHYSKCSTPTLLKYCCEKHREAGRQEQHRTRKRQEARKAGTQNGNS